MKERVLLLTPPAPCYDGCVIRDFYCSFSSKAGYYWPPQDLLALSGILREEYDIHVLDAVAAGLDHAACLKKALEIRPDIIVLSTGSISLSQDMLWGADIKKGLPVRLVASSGAFASCAQEVRERYSCLDGIITDFTDSLQMRSAFPRVVLSGEPSDFSIGEPSYDRFIASGDMFPFFEGAPFVIMVGSVGCRFSCGFCVAGTHRIKYRKLDELIRDVQRIRRLGVQKIFFVDPLFTSRPERVLEFCHAVKGAGVEWVCNAHAATIEDEHLLRTMKQAGCRALFIGVESGDDAILKRYQKATNTEQIKRVFQLCRREGLETLAYFIIGLPGETAASARRTIAFSKQIQCDYASFGLATPDEGTRLRKEALEKGWYKKEAMPDGLDSSFAAVLQTETFSRQQAEKLLQKAYRGFYFRPTYILKSLRRIRSITGLLSLCKAGWEVLKKSIL